MQSRFCKMLGLSALILAGCSEPPPPPPPPAAPPFRTVLDTRQFMEWVLDPAADLVWDSVKTIITEKETKEIAPKTDEDWAKVRTGAATLAEAGNLLMLEGRARDKKEWMAAAKRLTDNAEKALKAAEARNVQGVFDAGGEIYNACKGCHERYAPDPAAAAAAAAPEKK